MRPSIFHRIGLPVAMIALCIVGTWAASACTACYGQKTDSPLAQGMNWGIISLLGVILSVLAGVAGFFVFLARKAATFQDATNTAEPAIASRQG
jgi:cytosine/uracil/thiamine/allantoin permease